MSDALADLYRDHLATLHARTAVALERSGHDCLLIASGVEKYQFLDDRPYPFAPNPHFKHWLPLLQHPQCWLAIRPGHKPLLAYYQPDDYWHLPPAAPHGFWVEHFDIHVLRSPEQATQVLPKPARAAILGEADAALGDYQPNNPDALLAYLHYHRAYKTPYELAQLRAASQRAVRGHLAAAAGFRDGASELEIHRAYLAATAHNDLDLPYGNIVALNEHGAILHYQYQQAARPAESRAFLIDAGASHNGYAADITRSYSAHDDDFAALIKAVDRVQLELVDQVRPDTDYRAIHLDTHRRLAGVLREFDLVRMDAETMVESGVTGTFFPHGIGHLLGLQVHDVAGFQADDRGGTLAKPAGHPYLRLTRTLAPGMVVTIEPGLYFIDSLLAKLRDSAPGKAVNWTRVEQFRPFGGVRIEDDVVCTAGAPENLTREAFASAV